MRISALLGVAALASLAAPSATGKNFGPGDLRVCNATRCVPVLNRVVLPRLDSFYFTGDRPARVRPPPRGSPYYYLLFANGKVTGIVATSRLDRFLTYGVHDQRFKPHVWYAVPHQISCELRRLTRRLRPLSLTRSP